LSDTILGIDIGSIKICAVLAEKKNSEVSVIGSGISKSQGIKKGVITNIDSTAKAIKNAVNDAKRVAGTNFSKAIVSVSGAYVKGINSSGIVNIPTSEITIKEINRVIQTAIYNANIPNEFEVLHALPYNFKLDDQNFIDDPLGMTGSRLEVLVHIITAQKTNLNNLKKAVAGAGIEIENLVLGGYASSIAVLDEEEKDLGVAVINLGGATCNLVVHSVNSIRHNDFLAVGSYNITNDISYAFHTPISVAEKIKKEYITLEAVDGLEEEILELPLIGDDDESEDVTLKELQDVVKARVEETFLIIYKKLEDNLEHLGAGIVLTGGMTKLAGLKELAGEIFNELPVKVAKPKDIIGVFNPLKDQDYSTAIGLILYGAGKNTPYEIDSNRNLNFKTTKITDVALDEYKDNEKSESYKEESNVSAMNFDEQDRETDRIQPTQGSGAGKFWQWVTHLF